MTYNLDVEREHKASDCGQIYNEAETTYWLQVERRGEGDARG